MFSWFPIFFPLRESIQCNKLTQIYFDIKRKVDDNGVWYEWKINCDVILLNCFIRSF